MHCSINKSEQGFTLTELLVAMAISLVIMAGLSSAFISQRKTYAVQEQFSEMIQNARAAMDMISREVKMAGYAPTGHDKKFEDGTVTVQTSPSMQRKDPTALRFVGIPYNAITTQLQIIADLNGDGETDGTASNDDTDEEIVYTYDNTNKNIYRNTGGGPEILAENIQLCTFEYANDSGNATTAVADIRRIKITIEARTAKEDPDYEHPTYQNHYRTYELTSYVTPPNLDIKF